MAFKRSGGASGGGGTELASGYLSLSVRFSGAQSQIAQQFSAIEQQAAKTGEKSGTAMGTAITNGIAKADTRSAMDRVGLDMSSHASRIGANVGQVIGTTIGGAFKDVERVGSAAFKGVEYVAKNTVSGIGKGIKELATGPMTQILGATTVLGAAFATIGSGWKLDTDIQNAQVRMTQFGGSAQDVADVMKSVNDSVVGTKNGVGDLIDIAADLAQKGFKGDKLTQELKDLQNVSDATGLSLESTFQMTEKASGRDVVNVNELGQLEAAHFHAREELEKALNVSSDQLDDLVKHGKVSWDQLWDQVVKDSDGASAKMANTWDGQFHKLQDNVAKIGGDFLAPLIGSGGGFAGINSALERVDGWINSHQAQIKNFFTEIGSAARQVGSAIGGIIDWCNTLHISIGDIVTAFVAWESIKGIKAVVDGFGLIKDAVSVTSTLVSAFADGALAKLGVNLGIVASGGPAAAAGITETGVAADGAVAGATALGAALGTIVTALAAIAAGAAAGDAIVNSDWYKTLEANNPLADNPISHWINRNTPGFLGGDTVDPTGRVIAPNTGPVKVGVPTGPLPGGTGNPLGDLGTPHNPMVVAPAPDSGLPGLMLPPAGHAFGGIHGLPGQATIQSAMGAGGLVQWAENSTGGEAFIPLASSKRRRSLDIWKQTGKLLGMEDGGITAAHDFLATMTGGTVFAENRTSRTPYQLGGFSKSGIDCSGLVSAVVNAYLGQAPFSSRTATGGEASWLTKHGFVMGNGPAGTLRVGWYNGGPGGGHTALTLPDGTNVESTTSHGISGVRVGPLAAGADASEFSSRAYLPLTPAGGGKTTGGVPGTAGASAGGGGGAVIGPGGVDYGMSPSVGSGQTNGVGGTSGVGGGAPSQAQQEAEDKKERGLNDRIAGLNNDIQTLEQKQSEQTDKTKQSERDKVQNDIDGKRKELANAQSDLTQAQQDWNGKWQQSAGGQPVAGGKGFDFGHLADTAMSGITETLLPPGLIDPMSTPLVKGAAGILKYLSGLGQKHGGPLGGTTGGMLGLFGGTLGGSPSSGIDSLIQSFTPQAGGPIQAASPGSAPYADPLGLFGSSGSVGIVSPGDLPGLNTVFPQGSPASGRGSGALPGPSGGPGGGPTNITHNDFSGSNFQGDPGGVKKTLQDRDLAHSRKHATSTDRNNMPGSH